MADTDEAEVPVLKSDLETLHGTLQNLYFQNVSLDMIDSYRALDQRGRTSALTIQAEEAVTKVKSYIESVEGNDGEPDTEGDPEPGEEPEAA